ncbi:MAG: 3'(2'),5'-bisphosphate nucleotidase CysQ [Sphingomonadales bacterium]
MVNIDRSVIADQLTDIALAAGAVILDIYNNDVTVRTKDDRSPVTNADEAAEKLILARLSVLTPDIPVIAEERVARDGAPETVGDRFWLVDPLDGTREFISRNGEFTVNIALIEDGTPTLGVVFAPARGRLFWGTPDGAWVRETDDAGAWGAARPISVRPSPADGLTVVASRSHRDAKTDEYLERFDVKELISAGSSLKFCLVAAGEADLYPRLGRTMEWDTGAGHAVLLAAGGTVVTLDGQPLKYGKAPVYDNPFFVAHSSWPILRGPFLAAKTNEVLT